MANDLSRRRLGAWALALVLLAVGAATGAALDRLVAGHGHRPGPPTPAEMMVRMTEDLGLTETQARGVRQVLDQRWSALGELFERIDPEAEAIRKDADDRIRALLDPRQRERFDAQVAEQGQRRAEMRKRLGRPGPPPP